MSQPFFVFLQDDTLSTPYQPEGEPQVAALSWKALGGCESAQLSVPAAPGALPFWQGLLGKPVQIRNALGSLVWWGYVHTLAQAVGSLWQVSSLAGMANRVAVAYTTLEPSSPSYGEAQQTEWAEDSESIALFGPKDLLLSRGMMADQSALQLRNAALRQRALPNIGLQTQSGLRGMEKERGESKLLIQCLGWAEQLAWRVYQPPATVIGNTVAQQGTQAVGNTTSASKVGQSFVCDGDNFAPLLLKVRARRQGSPNDALRVAIQSDANGSPSGVEIANAQVNGAELEGEAYPWVKLVFSPPPQLTPGKTYWVVFTRTGTITASAYYILGIDEKLSFLTGTMKINNGSVWAQRNPLADLIFSLESPIQTSALLAGLSQVFENGPFSTVSVEFESGISTAFSASHPRPVQQVVAGALELGTAAGVPIVYTVTPQQELIFSLQPTLAEALPYWLSAEGELRDPGGERLLPGQLPVGAWVQAGQQKAMFITRAEIRAPDWHPRLES